MEKLENIKSNPQIKYRFCDTGDLINGNWIWKKNGGHFEVAGGCVIFTYKKYRFKFVKNKEWYPSCDIMPTENSTLQMLHQDRTIVNDIERFGKLWYLVPKEIQERATKHAMFLVNHFTSEYRLRLRNYQHKQPTMVSKITGKAVLPDEVEY